MSEKTEKQDPTKFVSLMVRDEKTPTVERTHKGTVDLGPGNWTVDKTEPITAKGLVKMEARRQKLLAQGKEVALVRTVLKPDDPKFGISRRQRRAQQRGFRPMQRMLSRRQKRLDVVIEEAFSESKTKEIK